VETTPGWIGLPTSWWAAGRLVSASLLGRGRFWTASADRCKCAWCSLQVPWQHQ
jgi:hypothetical protein